MTSAYEDRYCGLLLCSGSEYDFKNYELGRCSIRPTQQDRFVAVGTDNPEAKEHFLNLLNAEVMLEDARADSFVCFTKVSEHCSDVKWLNTSTVLASTGKGNLKLFSFDADKKEINHIGQSQSICSATEPPAIIDAHTTSCVCLIDLLVLQVT